MRNTVLLLINCLNLLSIKNTLINNSKKCNNLLMKMMVWLKKYNNNNNSSNNKYKVMKITKVYLIKLMKIVNT